MEVNATNLSTFQWPITPTTKIRPICSIRGGSYFAGVDYNRIYITGHDGSLSGNCAVNVIGMGY